jgi:hypothetical protein
MPYVMVPVPEEHVEDVMQFILRATARAALEPWDGASLNEMFLEVDEVTRSLLAFVARATLDGSDLTDVEAGRKLQLTPREASGILNELNATTRELSRPTLLWTRTVSERLPNGRVTEKRLFQMEFEVAELVRDAERAELADAADPLGESSS